MSKINEPFIYIYSTVGVFGRYDFIEDSYEKIKQSVYEEFCKIKKPKLYLNPSKYGDFTVYLNEEWTIEIITDIKKIRAFDTLQKILMCRNHICNALEQDDGEDNC